MEKLQSSSEEIIVINQTITARQQVQFVQAVLVLVGVMLGNSFSQWFYMLDILVGISLLVASLTGSCILELTCAKLPWNKPIIKHRDRD